MEEVELHATRCAICGREGNAKEIYAANIDAGAFNPTIFSARRLPDKIHYCLVKCKTCGLVRSDPIADPKLIAELYAQSTLGYANEVGNLRRTYSWYLKKIIGYGAGKGALLEIGCGNGFFLEEALSQGFIVVKGVEPSDEAAVRARPDIRANIICDVMRAGLFEPESFDVICMFQVLDHLLDPGAVLDECHRLLKREGFILCFNHNINALSAQILKERSPIIDIEHTYLFSPETIACLFTNHGFRVRCVKIAYNKYTLRYLFRLLPLPRSIRAFLILLSNIGPLRSISPYLPLGNMYLIAQKMNQYS